MKEDSLDLPLEQFNSSEGSGMRPISLHSHKAKTHDGRLVEFKEAIANEGIEKASLVEEKYLTLDDLVRDIHENPPNDIEYSRVYKNFGLLPLMRTKENGEDIVTFGLLYTEKGSNQIRDIESFGMALEENVSRYEKLGENIKREYLLLNWGEFEELEKLTQGKNPKAEREKRLDILNENADAQATYISLIRAAIKSRASDIHIEPRKKEETIIRFRKDGVLQTQEYKSKVITEQKRRELMQVIKGQAKMDVAENRRPQGGSIILKTREEDKENDDEIIVDLDTKDKYNIDKYNIRVSIMNTNHGEKAVLRILKSQEAAFNLKYLGYPKKVREGIEDLIKAPNGIILLTGPTGSGKTTTLYACLQELNTEGVNITTLEDPVEIDIPGLNQLQLNERAGVTFPVCLRSILRQDPDIIFIGEIRDRETTEIATQSAKTGHLVFSTLHARDAIDTLLRLQDFKIENRDLATLRGVISQRLVRRLCKDCLEEYSGRRELNDMFGETLIKDKIPLYKPRGDKNCQECDGTGYRGRIVIPELWLIGDEERRMIEKGVDDHSAYLELALKKGMWDLTYNGLRRAIAGYTSLDEIFRVAVDKGRFIERKKYIAEIIPKIVKELKERGKLDDTQVP